MAKEKRKKKKYSHANCETSPKTDSHGAATNHDEFLDITECTCLSKAQERKPCLLISSGINPTACPIHASKGTSVNKNRKTKKTDGAAKQPSLARRIGWWLIKKLTKGHRKEYISDNPSKARAATNSDDQSMLQMPFKYVIGGEHMTEYETELISCRQSQRLPSTAQTTTELAQDAVTSLSEMCKLALKYRTDRKNHNYRETDGENLLTTEVDNSECENYAVKNEGDNQSDICDTFLEEVNETVKSLREMCKLAVKYPSESNTHELNGTYGEKTVGTEEDNPKLDNNIVTTELDNDNTLVEQVQEEVRPLREICKAAIMYQNKLAYGESHKLEQDKSTNPEFDISKIDQMQVIMENDTDSDSCERAPEEVSESVMSLKERCEEVVKHLTCMETNKLNGEGQNQKPDPELDNISCDKKNDIKPPRELYTTAIRYANNGKSNENEDNKTTNDAAKTSESKAINCDANIVVPKKQMCSVAIKTEKAEAENIYQQFESNDFEINFDSNTLSVKSLADRCFEAIKHTDDIKIVSTNYEEKVSYWDKYDKTKEKDVKSNDKSNIDFVRYQAKSLTALCTETVKNTDYVSVISSKTEPDLTKCTELCFTAPKEKIKECLIAYRYSNNTKERKEMNEEKAKDMVTNPESDTNQIKTEICISATSNADDVTENAEIYPRCLKTERKSVIAIDKTAFSDADIINEFDEKSSKITTSTKINSVYDKSVTKSFSETCANVNTYSNDTDTKLHHTEQDLGSNKDIGSKCNIQPNIVDINSKSDDTLMKSQTKLSIEPFTINDDEKPGKRDVVKTQSYNIKTTGMTDNAKENKEDIPAFHSNYDERNTNINDSTTKFISTSETKVNVNMKKDIKITLENDKNDDDTKTSPNQSEQGHNNPMEGTENDTHTKRSAKICIKDEKINHNLKMNIDNTHVKIMLDGIHSKLTDTAKAHNKDIEYTDTSIYTRDKINPTDRVEPKINVFSPRQTDSTRNEIKQSGSDTSECQKHISDKEMENCSADILDHGDQQETAEADEKNSFEDKDATCNGKQSNIDSDISACRGIETKETFDHMKMTTDVDEETKYIHHKQKNGNNFNGQMQINDTKSAKIDIWKQRTDGMQETKTTFPDCYDNGKKLIQSTNKDTPKITQQEYGKDKEAQQEHITSNKDKTDDIQELHPEYRNSQMNISDTDLDEAIRNKKSLSDKADHNHIHDTDLDKAYKTRHNEPDDKKRQINCIDEENTNETKHDCSAELENAEQTKSANTRRVVEVANGTCSHTKRREHLNHINTDYCNETQQYNIHEEYDGGNHAESIKICTHMASESKSVKDSTKNTQGLISSTDTSKYDADKATQAHNDNTNPAWKAENNREPVQVNETADGEDGGIRQDNYAANKKRNADKEEVVKENDKEQCIKTEIKSDDGNEETNTKENTHQNVAAKDRCADLFFPIETILQYMVDACNDGRFKTNKKQKNKVQMQYQINYTVDLNDAISDPGIEIVGEKEDKLDTRTEENISQKRNEKKSKQREQYKNGQVHSITTSNDSKAGDTDADRSRNQTEEIGVGAKPKSRNIANENIIQADLKKMQNGEKSASKKTASDAAMTRAERRRRRKEQDTEKGSKPELAQEPELPPEPQPEQNQATTPCADPVDHQETSHRIAHRRRKRKQKKAKWY